MASTYLKVMLPLLLSSAATISVAGSCDMNQAEAAMAVCQTCHTMKKEEGSFVGPNLFGVWGRDIASLDDFFYSPALSESEGAWTAERLATFIENPAKSMPGTMMAFGGVRNAEQRGQILCFLEQLN